MHYFKVSIDCTFMIFGSGDVLYSFFSSISALLEKKGWGTRFPYLLRHFCDYGMVKYEDVDEFEREVKIVKKELQLYKITQAVYDYKYPHLEIPFDKTEYYNENTSLDNAYCAGDEKYGYKPLTAGLLTAVRHSRYFKAPILLRPFHFPDIINQSTMYMKCGRNLLKDEYPIVYGSFNKSESIQDRILTYKQSADSPDHFKNEYDSISAKLKEKIPITYYWYMEDGLENYTEADFEEYKDYFRQILQTDYFRFIFVDKNTPEKENPNVPLSYE